MTVAASAKSRVEDKHSKLNNTNLAEYDKVGITIDTYFKCVNKLNFSCQ